MREEDDMIAFHPHPSQARQPSVKPEWRCLAYYNCAICNRVEAEYIINVPKEHHLPIPVCSSCYHRTLDNETMEKK